MSGRRKTGGINVKIFNNFKFRGSCAQPWRPGKLNRVRRSGRGARPPVLEPVNTGLFGKAIVKNTREYQQDVMDATSWVDNMTRKRVYMFAVYDGHGAGNNLAALYAKKYLPQLIADEIHGLDLNQPRNEKRINDALMEAFCILQQNFQSQTGAVSSAHRCKEDDVSGSTVTVLLFHKTPTAIWSAFIGDSEAVAVYAKSVWRLATDELKAIRANALEKKRLRDAGGYISDGYVYDRNQRQVGGLAITRTLGDTRCLLTSQATNIQDWVNACVPFVRKLTIPPSFLSRASVRMLHTDFLLVIASDGLWDVLNPRQVQLFIEKNFRLNPRLYRRDTDLLARELIKLALKLGSTDNVAVLIVLPFSL